MSAAVSNPLVLSELSPASVALAHAAVKVAARPGEVSTGALRIRVLQVTDLPADVPAPESTGTGSWLRYSGRRHANGRAKAESGPSVACILLALKTAASSVLATESKPWASAISWDEEFFLDRVESSDELQFFCVDRTKNDPYCGLPVSDDAATCPGFVGKVCVPLERLPEGEEIEQWYPLIPKNSCISMRTALRVSLCFLPIGSGQNGGPCSVVPLSPQSEISSASPVSKQLTIRVPSTPPSPVPVSQHQLDLTLQTGILDYVIVVGPPAPDSDAASHESVLRFRYPGTDNPQFPLPTKIEWFCFPGGPEVIEQETRPRPRTFSFVLVGGIDGLSRCYVVCLVVYHRVLKSTSGNAEQTAATRWQGTCIAFLTRVPLIEDVTTCLFSVAHAWLAHATQLEQRPSVPSAEYQIHRLCREVLVPIRGLFGVRFALGALDMELVLPSNVSLHSLKPVRGGRTPSQRGSMFGRGGASPTKSPSTHYINIQHGFQPLVYSLAPIFELFDVKTIIHVTALILCEFRVLIHSTQLSLLTPVAEGFCALIYPFRWQHPYVPILPRVLSEYLQAPLPYILGVHSSWIPSFLENGRPEHLVLVDVDRGTIHVQEPLGPMLPQRFARGLHQRLNNILRPITCSGPVGDDVGAADSSLQRVPLEWNSSVEKQIRLEFVCFLAAMLMGYRECLFFVNQKLPVFNKRRFFANCAPDSEVVPFVTKLFSTQSFQAFLENHSSTELSVFHSIYLRFCRSKDTEWPDSMPSGAFVSSESTLHEQRLPRSRTSARLPGANPKSTAASTTPVYTMQSQNDDTNNKENNKEDKANGEADISRSANTDEGDDKSDEKVSLVSLGEKIDALMNKTPDRTDALFALDANNIDETYPVSSVGADQSTDAHETPGISYRQLAKELAVDPKVFEDNVHILQDPHQANQNQAMLDMNVSMGSAGNVGAGRMLSNEEESVEQTLHKCLTSVFASDDMLSPTDARACEQRFKSAYARELFVLILMQPSHQYVESGGGAGSTWYNPKGSGSCIGEAGFRLLARLASAMMSNCAIHEDFTNARGMLQVASQYYHYVEDKQSGVGFAKKEYLVTPLRLMPICRSLDMWQHAFAREIDTALLADPTAADEKTPNSVGDELFFSVIGSMVYDMLSFEVPLPKVHTFVAVMCSTYQKGKDLLDTLKQLVDNVYRALDMSKDIKPSPPKNATPPSFPSVFAPPPAPTAPLSPGGVAFKESPLLSRQYDLDTVIRRKMSVDQRGNTRGQHGATHGEHFSGPVAGTPPPLQSQRRRSSDPASRNGTGAAMTLLSKHGSPILGMSIHEARVACGHADARVSIVDADQPDRCAKLEGHTDAVVAVKLRGHSLISGSRDGTLRVWDLRATMRRRHLFSFFSSSGSASDALLESSDSSTTGEIDSAAVSKRSIVLKGHTAGVTCVEIGRQLATDRALVASGSDDGTVRLWETTRETCAGLLGNGKGGVSCVRFLPQLDNLATGCRAQTLKIWDLARSQLKLNLRAHRGPLRDIQITGDRLVTAANDRVVKVWDAAFRAGQSCTHELRDHGGPVQCISLGGPADPSICTGAADGVVRVWDLRYVQKGPRLALRTHGGAVTCLQRDFTKVLSASEDGGVRLWDLHSGACTAEQRAHQSGVTSLLLRDALVFSASWDGSLRLWDVDSSASR